MKDADFVHCMAYDNHGEHSTMEFAKKGITLAQEQFGNHLGKFTLGVPFYGRSVLNGEPKTYSDLIPMLTNNKTNRIGPQYYNSQETVRKKLQLAARRGIGGIMIWELGQDLQPFMLDKSLMHAVRVGLNHVQAGLTKEVAKDEL